MIRFLLIALGLTGAVMLFVPFLPYRNQNLDNILPNLGAELLGIVITVALVDRILTRERTRRDAKQLAWRALHVIDHAVWVWQGGSRSLDLPELKALVNSISDNDPLPPHTQILFMDMGVVATQTLRLQQDELAANRSLRAGIECLMPLATIGDLAQGATNETIRRSLLAAIADLTIAAGVTGSNLPRDVASVHRDTSERAQSRRHYGE